MNIHRIIIQRELPNKNDNSAICDVFAKKTFNIIWFSKNICNFATTKDFRMKNFYAYYFYFYFYFTKNRGGVVCL